MSSTEMQDEDWMYYSFRIYFWLMKPIGIWPLSLCVTTIDKIKYVVLTIVSSFLIGFLLIPCGLCAILKKGDLDTKIKMIGPLSFIIMATTKYYILVSRGDQIAKCIENIRSDWTRVNAEQYEENRRIMIENANFGKSLTIFCAGFTYTGGFFYTILMPLYSNRTEIIGNETVRIHAFQMYRGILDVRTSPSFEIVQFMQIVSGYVLYSLTIGACSLAAVFVTHTRGQFRIIIRKLENLVTGVIEKDNLKSTKEQLGDIIDHHLRILGFISKVEDLLNEICFVDIIGCTLNICFLGYYLLTEWERNETIGTLTYFALLISYLYNIFTLCFVGEILMEECANIGIATYMINWYRLPPKEALDLIPICCISNSSIRLTAGKFVALSLSNFCSVLKSSMAYLSILRQLTT